MRSVGQCLIIALTEQVKCRFNSPVIRLIGSWRAPNGIYLLGYAVKIYPVDAAASWHAAPHFAS